MVLSSILSLPPFGHSTQIHPPSPPSTPSSISTSSEDSVDTPSIETSAKQTLDCLTSHVYIGSDALQVQVLEELFKKHSEGGLLTLSINEAGNAADLQDCFNYVETTLGVSSEAWGFGIIEGIEYRSASCEAKLVSSAMRSSLPTKAPQASHLLALSSASLRSVISITSPCNKYTIHVVERPTVVFTPVSRTPPFSASLQPVGGGNIPTPEEWASLWRAWDMVTLQMIPETMLHQKPIDLRHKCLFYIGHIPTFLDMLLSKAIGGNPTEPAYFWKIFERGIDPHVDDPDHCHSHSEVPERDEDWPTLDTVMSFRTGVRSRLFQLYDDLTTGKRLLTRNIARTLVMTLEHEAFHIETLLYMLIQRAGTGTLPPRGIAAPPWDLLKVQWDAISSPMTDSVVLGPATLTLGHDDSEADDSLPEAEGRTYGWDNESPARQVQVGQFRASWRPVSNKEFLPFWKAGAVELPKSWVEENEELKVRTIYGLIPMDVAAEWPVLTAYDDLAAYAKSRGGRLPTEPELRLFLDTYDVGYEGGANTGFRNWHPVPATTGSGSEGGKGTNGGVWEWTTTLFDTHDGLVPTNLFTGYSTDFFDTKHQIVLGASYATLPRLGRRTLRNFWQRGYGYAWVGGRVVWDM